MLKLDNDKIGVHHTTFFGGGAPVAYGGSQARGPIEVVAANLCQRHSNTRSKPRLLPTPQLTAMPDP